MAKRLRLPNGFGSITKFNKRLRNKYLVRTQSVLNENGKYIRPILGFYKTYDEAYKALLEYNNNPYNIDDYNTYNFKYFVDKFENEKRNTITNETLHRYIAAIKSFEDLYSFKIKDLTYKILQEKLNNLPFATSKSALVVINYIYAESLKLNLISNDISKLLKYSPTKTKTVKRKLYTKSEIEKIYNLSQNIENVYADMIVVLFYTGARMSEIIELKRNNVFITERYFIAGLKTESGIDRTIPIHRKIEKIIKKYLNHNNEYLFNINNEKIKVSSFKYNFKKLLTSLEIINNTHSIRHTFISKMKSLEVNNSKLKSIVGHRNSDITDYIYTHYLPEDLIKIIDELEY